jgi:hypothetical protein
MAFLGLKAVMARTWRIEYEEALYHMLSRGNQRQAIFLDDEDRAGFCRMDIMGTLLHN